MKQLFAFIFLILFCVLVGKGWHLAKDGFQINRTFCPLPVASSPEMKEARVESALNQVYKYLGRGHQCYAFESEDGKYVIKLPRYDQYEISFFLNSVRLPFLKTYRETKRADIKKRLRFVLNSFQLAFNELREDTAVVCLHLAQTDLWQNRLEIKDRLGRSYFLDPDRIAFILQEKKPIMMTSFEECLRCGDRKGAEKILDSFLNLVESRARKGIFNKDPSFLRNFGWDGERAIQIDIGSYYRHPDKPRLEALILSFSETLGPVRDWLSQVDPELSLRLDEKIKTIQSSWAFLDL